MKKHFKQLISLLLILAALGALNSAFAAFTDDDTIKYKTAVGVMSGTGIINGYAGGSFQPKEYVTREQAAKMITHALIGEEGVSQLLITDTGFTDVTAECWSARYIKWCREQGIIDGLSDGTFNPSGSVTGYQMAKMLLCAAGYGSNGEYTGRSWELNASKDGFAKRIFTEIKQTDLAMNATREEAALYIFNAITRIEQVSYDATSEKYLPSDGTEEIDNTIAAERYGIITSGDKANTLRGIVTENAANSENQTLLNDVSLDYKSGLELLGHSVCVYQNAQEDLKNKIYYIADESETLELEQKLIGKNDFEKAFGERRFSKDILVYSDEGILIEQTTVEGLNPSAYTAPAGIYVFHEGVLISYLPIYPEFAALISESEDSITIANESYPAEAVYAANGYAPGDVVLARVLNGRVSIWKAMSITGVISCSDVDHSGRRVYIINGMPFAGSSIKDETGIQKIDALEYGKEYRFYLDRNYGVFSIVPAK